MVVMSFDIYTAVHKGTPFSRITTNNATYLYIAFDKYCFYCGNYNLLKENTRRESFSSGAVQTT